MVVLDLLGRKTAMRLLWELRNEPLTFRALEKACESNARLLNTRLTELKAARLIEHADGGYRLTAEGRRLEKAMMPLLKWAREWGEVEVARINGINEGASSSGSGKAE